ncbi:MAG TPA: hemerythrin domain-containing protein [Candidatus Binatia bacterium]
MPSATQLIRRDHKKVEGLFDKFEQTKKAEAKKRIADQVLQELEIHAKLEEEIFYPAVRKHLGEEDMLEEAKQEHEQAKKIMRELKKMQSEDEQLEETFSELVDCIKHHVEEEEGEMLPKVEESDMDLTEIGDEMLERKEELTAQMRATSTKSGAGRKPAKTARRRKSGRAA